ncbi:hypothetical protein PIB30_074872 [Stylosanthes scabra]|uniref:Uncharacterized protein n=1 Tax=Stylosanthes scabra TaxID=79078 RepID=A0ABU6RPM7_9FABA|nr:hypothetical protein [Stylosanthes scabra]
MENRLAIELEAMLKEAQPSFSTQSCCIYKVPHSIRKLNEDAYTPVLVSIGPLHHGNPRLVTMEAHKQFCCNNFIQRSKASLNDLVSCVQQLEPRIRACYSEKINLTADKLVEVIFIDCCFVIELFLEDKLMIDDSIFSKAWMSNRVEHDLKLLENQVPLFVFEDIYKLAFPSLLDNGYTSFMCLVFACFSSYNKQKFLPPAASSILHFTDLLRYFCLPQSIIRRNPGLLVLGHGASELVEGRVKFVENKASHGCMLALEFKDGTLSIPHIEVGDGYEIWLRNMVALEQCHYPLKHYILDYVVFLGHIMETSKDAGVIIKAGIINCIVGGGNYESSVAKLFGDVWKETLAANTNDDYLKICDDLNKYYNKNHPGYCKIATLRREYFTNRWKTIASIAAIVLLILTFIQTVCSILQVK